MQIVMETPVTSGKKSYNRFHSPTGELFEGFEIFPHLSVCLGGVEKSQNPKSFSEIWLWKRLCIGVIFSELVFFVFKSGKIHLIQKFKKYFSDTIIYGNIIFAESIFDVFQFYL